MTTLMACSDISAGRRTPDGASQALVDLGNFRVDDAAQFVATAMQTYPNCVSP